ncbi:MAG: hypothetical protein IIA70_08975 [Proteobacteria bacterium]|nr:hypothetical protein [Pseudomonadota bacterium]
METSPLIKEDEIFQFTAKSELICRAGKVKKIHEEGFLLCRGPCLETSIPVFGGMSGGPVFLIPEAGQPVVPFGLISSDPEALDEVKDNRAIAGSSLISLLSPIFPEGEENLNKLVFDMKNASWVSKKNPQ